MPTIYKYPLPVNGVTSVAMPKGAIIRHVGQQEHSPMTFMVWAEVDPRAKYEARTFHVYGDGHGMRPDPGLYLGTAHFSNGLVFHLYEPAT